MIENRQWGVYLEDKLVKHYSTDISEFAYVPEEQARTAAEKLIKETGQNYYVKSFENSIFNYQSLGWGFS